MVGAVEAVNTVVDVVAGMGMHNVDDHKDSQLVSLVHQVFEVVRRPLARTRSEVARHVVSKRPVIRVLLDSHQLHTVVAALLNVGQDLVCKLTVGSHSAVLSAHAYVRFVNF